MTYQLHHGNCIDIMPLIERESIDAVICDPPYGLGFMGKDWDHGVPGMHFWLEALRCAKPGAYLLAFGGTRTFHRLAVAIEDAGWEIRDTVMWVYGQGFPKSHDVSKAIDREAGAEREVIGSKYGMPGYSLTRDKPRTVDFVGGNGGNDECNITQPATPAAAEWDGWGTALKPSWEPVIVARKPLCGTVAENVQRYGTGAMNIDGCRIETSQDDIDLMLSRMGELTDERKDKNNAYGHGLGYKTAPPNNKGRWPANLIHDGSAEVLAGFPNVSGPWGKSGNQSSNGVTSMFGIGNNVDNERYKGNGSAARFFYCAKASKQDRDEGLEGLSDFSFLPGSPYCPDCGLTYNGSNNHAECSGKILAKDKPPRGNHHPTVKPTALMRYLCRLVTPPSGTILDPFMGSGSTGKAAMLEGFNFIGIDTELEYVEIAARRIEHACEKVGIVIEQPMMFETKRETVDRPKQLILL